MPALRRARDIFFPEPRPFKGLPGRDPYASVFSTAPQLMERYNKREQLYGRFIDPDPRNKVDVKLLRMHFDNFPSRLSGRPTPAPPTQTQAAQPPNNKKRKTVGATKKEEEGQDGGGEHDKENPEEELDKPQKRKRRLAKEINRKFACPFPRCDKAYGTQGALDQHMRKKHADARLHMPALQPILQNPLHPMPFRDWVARNARPVAFAFAIALDFIFFFFVFVFVLVVIKPDLAFPVDTNAASSSTLGTGNSAKAPAGLVGKYAPERFVGTQQQQQQLPPPPEPLPPPPPLLATPPAITNTTSTIVQGDPMYLDRQ
ncbi:zinc finger, c2h2 type domain containing protein [Acanthamoeba castellanii str. Neff]|uniref:Zinc finger, c2h2 type domain containing protein n=1 Tax=Acanthamoeba castellanii (strain ATCC 30010 / Neff) TaxID=1257118 RepID=L8GPW6_ACACF|nr:zinc finger, c2h2 type domain containing protein [Acanthamoeba castellanii str. Neff]ELR14683.1 zinc finger, c2h2 type domain containing protein [Acanthamoeba castellanii str. Neff]